MAFDVYVGTLTRFYRGEWENVAQRMAREQGFQYRMIQAGGEPEPPPPAEEIRNAIGRWWEGLSEALQPHGVGEVAWDEGEEQPYFTDRPGWEGYRALMVWAAHAEHPDLPLPSEVPDSWADDPAYARSTEREFRSKYPSILQPEIWLPVEFPFVFDGPTLAADKSCIGSVFRLKMELDALHEATGARLQELKAMPRIVAAAPARKAGFLARLFSRPPEVPKEPPPRLAEVAEYGLGVFRELAGKACEYRLPMVLNY